MIGQIADLTVTPIIWLLVLYRAKFVWTRRDDQRVTTTWLFIFFFALCMTFHVDDVYKWVGGVTHIYNLAWLLAYASWLIAAYFSVAWVYNLSDEQTPKLPKYVLGISLFILCSVFGVGVISTTPDTPNHSVAETAMQLVFMQTLYICSIGLCVIPAYKFARLWRDEKNAVTRFRMSILCISVLSAITVFALRSVFVAADYFQVALPTAVHELSMAVLIVGGASLGLFFVPQEVIKRPILFIEKSKELWGLDYIDRQITAFCPPIRSEKTTFWKSVSHLDKQLFRTVKSILDGKFILRQCVQHINSDFSYIDVGNDYNRAAKIDPQQWGQKKSKRAVNLFQQLESIADDKEYQALIKLYGNLGRNLQLKKVALWVSRIFHPFILPIPVLFAVIYLEGFSIFEAMIWTGLFVAGVILPTTLFILWNVRTGRYSDRDVSDQTQRRSLYVMGLLSVTTYLTVVYLFNAPWIVSAMMWSIITASVIAALINRYMTKVSIHTIAAVGSATVLFLIAPYAGIAVGIIALCLSWSRIQLGHHSVNQVALGWIVAIGCAVLVYQLFNIG